MKKKPEWSADSTLVFLILLHWSLKHISKINRKKFKFEIQSEKYGYGQRFQTSMKKAIFNISDNWQNQMNSISKRRFYILESKCIPKSKSKIQTPI